MGSTPVGRVFLLPRRRGSKGAASTIDVGATNRSADHPCERRVADRSERQRAEAPTPVGRATSPGIRYRFESAQRRYLIPG